MNENSEILYIPIEKIVANKNQPRKDFQHDSLKELALSICEYGVIQPITLKKIDNNNMYEIIAGERRFRASEIAGLKHIPSIITDFKEEESAAIALVENIQRENLNYMEEAEAYRKMIENFGMTQNELANKISKSQSSIANKLRLLKLGDDIRTALIKENLTERHGRALLKIPNKNVQKEILDKIIRNKLNVKDTEKIIEKTLNKVEKVKNYKIKSLINYKIYINTIKKAFNEITYTGIKAEYNQYEQDDFVEIKIRIPKGR